MRKYKLLIALTREQHKAAGQLTRERRYVVWRKQRREAKLEKTANEAVAPDRQKQRYTFYAIARSFRRCVQCGNVTHHTVFAGGHLRTRYSDIASLGRLQAA